MKSVTLSTISRYSISLVKYSETLPKSGKSGLFSKTQDPSDRKVVKKEVKGSPELFRSLIAQDF